MKFVVVRWMDSRGPSPVWERVGELTGVGIGRCVSIGWLAHETDECLVVAPHVAIEEDGDHQTCGTMWIPRTAVTSVHEIALPEEHGD